MYRILVCDDEKEIVSSLTACLTAEGYQVVTARTGWEVLNILSKQPIHLALLGTKLPGLDGLTTVTRLRQTHDLPVILLTSGTDSTENILGLTIGAMIISLSPFSRQSCWCVFAATSAVPCIWCLPPRRPSPSAASRWTTMPDPSPSTMSRCP